MNLIPLPWFQALSVASKKTELHLLNRKSLVCAVVVASLASTAAQADSETVMWRSAMAATTVALYLTNALDADAMTVDVGGGEDVYFLRYVARWEADYAVQISSGLEIRPALQVSYSKWQSSQNLDRSATNNVVDLLPVFRWQGRSIPIVDYIDTGVGLSLFSSEEISDLKFGGPLQFNNYLGIGWYLGQQSQWELSLRLQHYSNNDMYEENNGINLPHISVGYRY